MSDFRKRLEALERRMIGTPTQRMGQRVAGQQVCIRWFLTERLIGDEIRRGVRDVLDGDPPPGQKAPADPEAAWVDFCTFCQTLREAGTPLPDMDHDTFVGTWTQMRSDDMIHGWELDPT